MISNLLFLLAESLRGWVRHRRLLFPTLITVILGALLLEGVLSVWVVSRRISPIPDDSWKIDLFLTEEGGSSPQLDLLLERIESDPGVERWHFVAPAEAARRFRAEFGDDALDLIGDDQLPASVEVWPRHDWKSPFQYRPWLLNLQSLPGVELATSSIEALEWWSDRQSRVELLVGVSALLLLAAIYLILGNALRMTLLARTLLIENMKYVGASEWFILLPFAFEALLLGLVAGGVAWGSWELLLWGARLAMPGWELWFAPLGWSGAAIAFLLAAIGFWNSLRAVRHHLRQGSGA